MICALCRVREPGPMRSVCEHCVPLTGDMLDEPVTVKLRKTHETITAVLALMDDHAKTWGDEGVFRRCRDRLRALLPQPLSPDGR